MRSRELGFFLKTTTIPENSATASRFVHQARPSSLSRSTNLPPMTISRDFQDIRVLIPGYSIEDLPTDLNEANAASLLNAFSVAWHPSLLARSKSLPEAFQAESTELPTGQHFVFVPDCSEEWLAHDWHEQLSDTLSLTFHDCSGRDQWLAAVQGHFPDDQPGLPDDLLQDFLALGTNHLLVTWLSRRMHHFVEPDQHLLSAEAFAAATAALAGDIDTAREHLRRCFECLLDCREQFHPTDCFLLDICLPSDQTTADELATLLRSDFPLSLICSGQELQDYCQSDDAFAAQLADSIRSGNLSILAGQQHELRTSLGSLSAVYGDIEASRKTFTEISSDADLHWSRRRYGMTSSTPAVLGLFGAASALHIVLDDGIYPDREFGQLEWQAADGSTVAAVSRIPMAIDGAASFLRFIDRFTESLQEDSTAVILLARLPKLQTPWLNDLQRAAGYAPVLGRFTTMSDFIEQTRGQASPTSFSEGEYLSPYLIQSSVLKTEAPISSPAALHAAHCQLEGAAFAEAIATVLKPRQAIASDLPVAEDRLAEEEGRRLSFDAAPADTSEAQVGRLAAVTDDVAATAQSAVDRIMAAVPSKQQDASGVFLANTLPWNRSITLPWPAGLKPPATNDCIVGCWQQDAVTQVAVDLPAGGFAWLHESGTTGKAMALNRNKGKALAEPLLLRNQFFEVQLSDKTGGVAGVVYHGTRANRVSQQIAFRYEQSKTVTVEDDEVTLAYAASRMVSSQVLCSGPLHGSIETTCEIADVATGAVLARYRQTTSVERNSPRLNISIQFDELPEPPVGNPWMTYYAVRLAWDNEAASIVRSCLGQAAGFRMERFEAPDYVEVSDHDSRLLIFPHGRSYHRRSGHRMLDSLLMVEGEDALQFALTLEFDQPYPMRAAAEILSPPLSKTTAGTVPAAAASAWIFGLSAKNVVAARTRVLASEGNNDASTTSITMLLQETEGRSASCLIKTARPPKAARIRLATGETVQELQVTAKGVPIEFSRFQMKQVELTF